MTDILQLDKRCLPIHAVFWRASYDCRGRCTDITHHRNPLFSSLLDTSPEKLLAIDTLHTVNYGPLMRITACTLWRVVLSNPWDLPGSDATVIDQDVRRIRLGMRQFFDDADIPHDRRIGDLTLTMLGDRRGCVVRGDYVHPGCVLKTKAAETSVLFQYALNLLESPLGANVKYRNHLLAACHAMKTWLEVTRTDDVCLSASACQQLVDSAQRHLIHSDRAHIAMVPKHHFLL